MKSSIGKNSLIAIFLLTYLVVTGVLYQGPLNSMLNDSNQHSVWFILIWNYGAMIPFSLVLWGSAHVTPTRELPKLPATKVRVASLVVSLLITSLLIVLFWHWIVADPLPGVKNLISYLTNSTSSFSKLATNRIINGIFALIPTTALVLLSLLQLKGWRRQTFSLTWYDLGTTLMLIGVSSLVCLFKNRWLHSESLILPVGGIFNIIVVLLCQFMINGLQEETFFRGYIFPQLFSFLRQPWLACWIMVGFFNSSHIPSYIIGSGIHLSWWKWILWSLFTIQPTGWLYGLIYYCRRTVMPGAIFHTYTTVWGMPFI